MKLNLETNSKEQELIKAYLEENASDVLAEKIDNGTPFEKDGKTFINKKTLDGFMKYASSEARKLALKGANSACVEDKVVYGWAIHYFEEDSIEGTLYNEDGTEYKPALAPKKQATKKPSAPPKPEPKPQMSLFDFMGDKTEQVNEAVAEIQSASTTQDEEYQPSEEEIQEILAELHEEEQQQQEQLKISPVYQRYTNIQSQYTNCVVAYRLGDFYEVFGENAVEIAKDLDMTLTSRDFGLTERIPMIGFPFYSADMYFTKLTSKGYTLAICESDDNILCLPEREEVIDENTGEILNYEEMREFDDDLKEPAELLREEKEFAKSFDEEMVAVLSEILGDIFIVR